MQLEVLAAACLCVHKLVLFMDISIIAAQNWGEPNAQDFWVVVVDRGIGHLRSKAVAFFDIGKEGALNFGALPFM